MGSVVLGRDAATKRTPPPATPFCRALSHGAWVVLADPDPYAALGWRFSTPEHPQPEPSHLQVEAAQATLMPAVLAALEEDSPTARLVSCHIVSHFLKTSRDAADPDRLLKVYPGRTLPRSTGPCSHTRSPGGRIGFCLVTVQS